MIDQALRSRVRGAVDKATRNRERPDEQPARFVISAGDGRDADQLAAEVAVVFPDVKTTVSPLSPLAADEFVLTFPELVIDSQAEAFDAAHQIEDAFRLTAAEPEIFHHVMPVDPAIGLEEGLESVDRLPPGCWVDPEDHLNDQHDWALTKTRVQEAWQFAAGRQRPSKGAGIVIAQPDTGVTEHRELANVDQAGSINLLDGEDPDNATDPLKYSGTPGHGTATASVVVSPEADIVIGSAPLARHIPIRAIQSVVRLSQTKVAEAIDRAVQSGAHVITMSLGGIFSFALRRALARAVAADVIVLAAAGNCVKLVVWPARFRDCIAVAGTDSNDNPWRGTCRGPDVDIAAPAQNIYRASVGEEAVGQGQGTSFAVALTAGIAACWLAFHGRSRIVAEAHARGETVQTMFRRLLKATARRPDGGWDSFSMGAGVVDALALLQADFDANRDTEGPMIVVDASSDDNSVRDLALEAFGDSALEAVDWQQHGAEVSLMVLERQARGRSAEAIDEIALEAVGDGFDFGSDRIREDLPADLLHKLGTEVSGPEGSAALESMADHEAASFEASAAAGPRAPTIRRPVREQESAPADPDRVRKQRRLLAARIAAEGGLESSLELEATLPDDADIPAADDVLAGIDSIMARMPASEIGDPQAFRGALETLYRYGEPALRKLAQHDERPGHGVTLDQMEALEAVVIADGSRPSFLVRGGLLPEEHPFLGNWRSDVLAVRQALKGIADAVGRVQPTGGHASNFVGTALLVDRDKLLALTNYHVLDDARVKFGVPMSQSGRVVKIHRGLELDFIAEADSLAQNRFKVVEAILPDNFGRGFGRLDATVFRLEALNGDSELPSQVIGFSSAARHVTGEEQSLCTIGYPGRPRPKPGGAVDWSFVLATLFANRFGLKRLAPGRFSQALGSHPSDAPGIVFSHDATTFGGASGSCVVAWTDDGKPCFGLHFAGKSERANYAISIAKTEDALRKVGVPIP